MATITELKELMRRAIRVAEYSGDMLLANNLRQAIADMEVQEPVAWENLALAKLGYYRDLMPDHDVKVVQAFLKAEHHTYTSPRLPLTDEDIIDCDYPKIRLGERLAQLLDDDHWNEIEPKLLAFARAIERRVGGMNDR